MCTRTHFVRLVFFFSYICIVVEYVYGGYTRNRKIQMCLIGGRSIAELSARINIFFFVCSFARRNKSSLSLHDAMTVMMMMMALLLALAALAQFNALCHTRGSGRVDLLPHICVYVWATTTTTTVWSTLNKMLRTVNCTLAQWTCLHFIYLYLFLFDLFLLVLFGRRRAMACERGFKPSSRRRVGITFKDYTRGRQKKKTKCLYK